MFVDFLISSRFLKSSKNSSFFSSIAFLCILGISIGTASMIVVLTVLSTFEKELRARFLPANAHILLYKLPDGLENYEKTIKTIKKDFPNDIKGLSPFIYSETMASKDHILSLLIVRGIYPKKRQNVQDLKTLIYPNNALDLLQKEIEDENLAVSPIIIGKILSEKMQSKIGDNIYLISPGEDYSFSERKIFNIVGIYDSGLYHYDSKLAIISLTAAKNLFYQNNVTGIEIGLKKPYDSGFISTNMREKYSNFQIKEWQSFNSHLFEAIKIEKAVIAILVFLVGFVSIFNILTVMFVSISQKQRQISILKTLGASHKKILMIFTLQGLKIGFIGSSFGLIIAFIIIEILKRWQDKIINLPEIYYMTRFPLDFNPILYLIVFVIALFNSVIASLYPAWISSKTNIVKGIQDQNFRT